jgi:hypothetical protein
LRSVHVLVDAKEGWMFRERFTPSEWETIQFTPLWTSHAVAAADGKIDPKEAGALAKEVSEAMLYKDEFTREVLASIASDMHTVMPAYMRDTRNVLQGLGDAARVLDEKMPGGQADSFKRAMLGIGIETAKAAGPMIGDKVAKEEKAALAMIAAVLRVPLQG